MLVAKKEMRHEPICRSTSIEANIVRCNSVTIAILVLVKESKGVAGGSSRWQQLAIPACFVHQDPTIFQIFRICSLAGTGRLPPFLNTRGVSSYHARDQHLHLFIASLAQRHRRRMKSCAVVGGFQGSIYIVPQTVYC